MKALSIIATGLLISTLNFYAVSDIGESSADDKFENKDLLSCAWVTYCQEPDIYSPVPKPKGDKTETQDTKDEKLA